jgi:hypothetical protein
MLKKSLSFLRAKKNAEDLVEFANSFRVHSGPFLCSPRRCPGLEFANAFGVANRHEPTFVQFVMPLKAFCVGHIYFRHRIRRATRPQL